MYIYNCTTDPLVRGLFFDFFGIGLMIFKKKVEKRKNNKFDVFHFSLSHTLHYPILKGGFSTHSNRKNSLRKKCAWRKSNDESTYEANVWAIFSGRPPIHFLHTFSGGWLSEGSRRLIYMKIFTSIVFHCTHFFLGQFFDPGKKASTGRV